MPWASGRIGVTGWKHEIVAPLEAEADARRRAIAARAAATKVDFFTVAREANS